jgi:hypothetical protein
MAKRRNSPKTTRPQEIDRELTPEVNDPTDQEPRPAVDQRVGGPSDPTTRDGDSSRGNVYESETEFESTDNDVGDDLEDTAAHAGRHGGATGGTPARGRATGDSVHRGIRPGSSHRGDSTIGSDPTRAAD